MASSAPRRSPFERSLRGEAIAGDAGLVNVAVNVLASAPLAWGLALAVTRRGRARPCGRANTGSSPCPATHLS